MTAWGVVRAPGTDGQPRVARRDGDEVRLVTSDDGELACAFAANTLNPLINLGPSAWSRALEADGDVVPLADCETVMPVRVVDYVDFYTSEEHAKNFLSIWFGEADAQLPENFYSFPVAYHGRTSTVYPSDTDIRRPAGILGPGREFGPTRMLDLECEVGFVCGPGSTEPVSVDAFDDHVFGVVLLNDWSARDIQRFEMPPLGPFLGKSFAVSISSWVTPMSELAEARVAPHAQDPPPAPYLTPSDPWALDIALSIEINGEVVSRPNASWLYWQPQQMLAHMTVNGALLSTGDLFGTGTVSKREPGTEGSLGEIGRGERWLADGDEVVLRGVAAGVELGEVRGRILPTPG